MVKFVKRKMLNKNIVSFKSYYYIISLTNNLFNSKQTHAHHKYDKSTNIPLVLWQRVN